MNKMQSVQETKHKKKTGCKYSYRVKRTYCNLIWGMLCLTTLVTVIKIYFWRPVSNMARNSGHCVRTGIWYSIYRYSIVKKSYFKYFAILSECCTKKVLNWKSMNYHDFSFFLSFIKYNIFYIEIYWGIFCGGGAGRRLLGIACENKTQYDCFLA